MFLEKQEAEILLRPWSSGDQYDFDFLIQENEDFKSFYEKSLEEYREDPYVMISADLSQAELRAIANLADEVELVSLYNEIYNIKKERREVDLKTYDVHYNIASSVWGKPISEISKEERRYAKSVSFALLYGADYYGISLLTGLPHDVSKQLIKSFWKKYYRIQDWYCELLTKAYTKGYVKTPFGRVLYLPKLKGKKEIVPYFLDKDKGKELFKKMKYDSRDISYEVRKCLNFPVQSYASDIMLFTMSDFKEKHLHKFDAKMHALVHDSIVPSVRSSQALDFMILMNEEVELAKEKYNLKCPIEMEFEIGFDYESMIKVDVNTPLSLSFYKKKMIEKFLTIRSTTEVKALGADVLKLFDDVNVTSKEKEFRESFGYADKKENDLNKIQEIMEFTSTLN